MPLGTHPGRIRATKLNLSPHHGDAANAQPFTGFAVRRPSPVAAVLVAAGDLKADAASSVASLGFLLPPEIYRLTKHQHAFTLIRYPLVFHTLPTCWMAPAWTDS